MTSFLMGVGLYHMSNYLRHLGICSRCIFLNTEDV